MNKREENITKNGIMIGDVVAKDGNENRRKKKRIPKK